MWYTYVGFLDVLDDKESDSNAGDLDLVPGSRRSPKGGNDYPLQFSCLEISMDRGTWRGPWGRKSLTIEQLMFPIFHFSLMLTLISRLRSYQVSLL